MVLKKDRDLSRELKTNEEDIPRKLALWNEWCESGKKIILQGTDKYTGAEKDKSETIDIMPQVVGEQGYIDFVICDILKRLIRFRNDRRQRDLMKINVWCYLLNKYLTEKSNDEKAD